MVVFHSGASLLPAITLLPPTITLLPPTITLLPPTITLLSPAITLLPPTTLIFFQVQWSPNLHSAPNFLEGTHGNGTQAVSQPTLPPSQKLDFIYINSSRAVTSFPRDIMSHRVFTESYRVTLSYGANEARCLTLPSPLSTRSSNANHLDLSSYSLTPQTSCQVKHWSLPF